MTQSGTHSDEFNIKSVEYFFVGSMTSTITSMVRMWDLHAQGWCEVECQLDTGTTCNVISKQDFLRVSGKQVLHGLPHSNGRLQPYDGSVMKPLG
jgi:hypothetical protein